jgi:hypothetical protein
MGWLVDLLRRLWEWVTRRPRAPVITAIRADPTVVSPGGESTITVEVRGGRRPYSYEAAATSGHIWQVGDGIFRWRDG